MKPDTWARVREIFEEALALPAPERPAFVESSCYEDDEIRREVKLLLAEDEAAIGFLDPSMRPDLPQPPPMPGTRIGRYELIQVLASGGMGTIYEALQDEPRRTVALKMMRHGLRSPSAVNRFRFEAEVLGRLQHPSIAQVFESGTHKEGDAEHPFFAMEIVEGAKNVLEYAGDGRLSLRDRLELFVAVCDAVHHGHQRGVIHRDLKPGNLLVDSVGRVKVIDFGVARATGTDRAASGFETHAGQIVGTLQYMSPEQLEGDPDEVDVRTDVYGLGVVLYELLTGQRPYDLAEKSIEEAARTVREAIPKRPRDLPADLAWVTLKALEKDPGRRYPSAYELATELRRFLNHEPVLARAPSAGYRLLKFVRRHRVPVAALVAIIAAISIGWYRAEVHARDARRARDLAEIEAEKAIGVSSFFASSLSAVAPHEQGTDVLVLDVLEEASRTVETAFEHPAAQAIVRRVIGDSYRSLGKLRESEAHLSAVVEYVEESLEPDDPFTLQTMRTWAKYLNAAGRHFESEEVCREFLPIAEERLGREAPVTVGLRSELATNLDLLNRYAEAEELTLENLEVLQEADPESRHLIPELRRLASIRIDQGEEEEAREILADALAICRKTLPADDFQVPAIATTLGNVHFRRAEWSDAEEMFRVSLEWCERNDLPPDHADRLSSLNNLCNALTMQGNNQEAIPYLEDVLILTDRKWGDDGLRAAISRSSLSFAYREAGRTEEAETLILEALEIVEGLVPEDHDVAVRAWIIYGRCLEDREQWEEAEEIYRRYLEIAGTTYGRESQLATEPLTRLVFTLKQQGKYEEAVVRAEELLTLADLEETLEWARETIEECRDGGKE